jgi:4-amino-4-deoxy-L-arabinose transferase-like glycosyltransferase
MKSAKRTGSKPKSSHPESSPATIPFKNHGAQALPGSQPGRLSRIVLYLAMAALLYQFGVVFLGYIRWATMAVGFPFPLDYGEGPLLDDTLRMAHFENIYRSSFSSPPYTIANYPPLFMLAQVPLYWIFGPALWYGRLLSIVSAFLAALFIFLIIFTLTRDRIGAAVGGLFFLALPYVRIWSMFNRIDELALAFSCAALFVTVRYVGRTDDRPLPNWGFWLAVSLFVLSIYTRQTYALAGPFAAVAWLIFGTTGSRRNRIGLACKLWFTVGGIALALLLALNVFTDGGFYLNTVTANINTFYWRKVYVHAREIRDSFYPLLIISGLFLLIEPWLIRQRTRIWPLALSYLLAAVAGSVTIGKTGSNVNYLIEFCAALSLASGSALAWIGNLKWKGKAPAQTLIVVVFALQLSMLANWRGTDFKDFGDFLAHRVANKENIGRLEQIVKSSPGTVLADEYMGLIPLAGKGLYIEPFGFKQLAEAHILDETSFVSDIRNRKFDAVLLYQPKSWSAIRERWTPAQLAMLQSAYRLDAKIDNVYILRPLIRK